MSILTVSISALFLLGQSQPSSPTPANEPVNDAWVEAQLDRVLERVAQDQRPLHQIIDDLRQQLGINLVVDWHGLASFAVTRDLPISMHARQVRARSVLELGLELASPDVFLGFDVRDGVVYVAALESLNLKRDTRVYDVRALVDAAATELLTQLPQKTADERSARQRATEGFVDILTHTVHPDVWVQNGGLATVKHLDGILIVNADRRTHRSVEA